MSMPRIARPSVLLAALAATAPAVAQGDGFPGLPWSAVELTPSPQQSDDSAGFSVALDGDTLVLGTPHDNTKASHAGAVHVFVRTGGVWTPQAELHASDGDAGDRFGYSVDLQGDRLLVGAPWQDSPGQPADAGAAYVFVRSGTTWTQEAQLTEVPPRVFASFGISLALDGDRAVVGAPAGATFVADAAGRATVFLRSGTTWAVEAELREAVPDKTRFFAESVDLDGSTIAVAVPGDDAAGSNAGALQVWTREGSRWSLQQGLTASDGAAGDELGKGDRGRGVALQGDTVVAGARFADPDGKSAAGAAWVWTRSGNTWTEEGHLLAADGVAGDELGTAVALDGDLVVAGAPQHDVFPFTESGKAYAWARDNGAWNPVTEMYEDWTSTNHYLGAALAVDGATVLAGQTRHLLTSVGITTGRATVFTLLGSWTDLGSGLAGADGTPALLGEGTLLVGTAGALTLSGAAASAPALLFVSFASTPVPFKGGTLVPVPTALALALPTSPAGSWSLAWSAWPAGVPAGAELWFQVAIADAGAPQGVALSNAERVSVP